MDIGDNVGDDVVDDDVDADDDADDDDDDAVDEESDDVEEDDDAILAVNNAAIAGVKVALRVSIGDANVSSGRSASEPGLLGGDAAAPINGDDGGDILSVIIGIRTAAGLAIDDDGVAGNNNGDDSTDDGV